MSYHVVYVYTDKAPDYVGIRTSSTWESKEDFDEVRARYGPDKQKDILAEGVTKEKAHELVVCTPRAARLGRARYVLQESIKEKGEVNIIASREAKNAFMAAAMDKQERKKLGLE